MQILIRILGLMGLVLSIIPFQFNKHKYIVLCKMGSCLSFALQYFLIGPVAHTAAWLDMLSAFRNFLYYKLVDKKISTLPVVIMFSVVILLIGFSSWQGAITLIAIIPKLITTVSYGIKNETILRLVTFPSCLFWIAYNLIVGNYEAAISDFLTFMSILIAIYRYDIKKIGKKLDSATDN